MQAKTIEIYGKNRHEIATKTRIGCRGIVVQDGDILISHEQNTDQYFIPGGGLEEGETIGECCAREVLEETGYAVKPTRHFLTVGEYYEEYKYVSHYFLCEVIAKKEPCLTEEEAERGLVPKWLPLQMMLELFGKHEDYAAENEEKRGAYLREYRALVEYLALLQ